MDFVEIIFFISLMGLAYSYFLYPLVLLFLPKQSLKTLTGNQLDDVEMPFISIIITAYNEETRIVEKINNTLQLDYPRDKREILIASDGSTDNTNKLVTNFSSQGVELINVTARKGKENAQLSAILRSKGDIMVFSDVATIIPANALRILAGAFSDTKIGAISSEDRFITSDGSIAGEGVYVRYEMWLRRLEARVKSLVGLSGSFFACRKAICVDWDINVPSDFNTALNCVSSGYIAISHPEVLGYYPNIKDESKEYNRKLRTVIRGITALFCKPSVLNPFKYGLFAFEVFSHKLMRWLVPWFMLTTLFLNILIVELHKIYIVILSLQLLVYGLAIFGFMSPRSRKYSIVKIPYFFIQVNLAITQAMLMYISGKRITKWQPSKR